MANEVVGTPNSDGVKAGQKASTATESQEKQQKNDKLEFAYVENELIYNYDEPTYYFRWGLISQQSFSVGRGLTNKEYRDKNKIINKRIVRGLDAFPGESFIVAETGVTADLNIRTVEFDSVIGLEDGTTKGNATVIKLEIFEPFGLSLPDSLSLAANILGVKNWLTAPMHILELKFKGKKRKNPRDTNSNDDNEAFGDCVWNSNINQKSNFYTWQLQIMKMTAKADSGGTVYNIEAALAENFAKDVQHNTIAKMINGKKDSGHNTPELITTYVAEQMTEHIKTQRGNGIALPDNSYEIIWETSEELEKDLSTVYTVKNPPWTGPLAPAQEDTARTKSMGIKDDGSFSWNDGTSIQQIITDLQVSSEELRVLQTGKRFMSIGSQEKVAIDPPDIENKRVYKYEFRVETETILKAFDFRTQSYAYHFVFHVVPFATSLGISDEDKPKTRDKKDAKNREIQKNRIKRFRQSGIVRKKYDYIYTGLNQEVLNFDIDMNLFFFAQIPKATSSYTETDIGPLITRAKQEALRFASTVSTIENLEGNGAKAIRRLGSSLTGDIRKAAANAANINLNNELSAADLLKLGTAAVNLGVINNDVQEVIDDTAERIKKEAIDTANAADLSTNIDIRNAQVLLKNIAAENNALGGVGRFFGIGNREAFEGSQSSLAIVGNLDGKNSIEQRQALVETFRLLQEKIVAGKGSSEQLQQINAARTILEDKIVAEQEQIQKKARAQQQQSLKESGRRQSNFLLDQRDQFNSPEERAQFQKTIRDSHPALFPLAVKADVSDVSAENDTGVTQNDPASASQSLAMAMLNQIYGANALFQKIQLIIRGDPFWIGPGVERQIGFDKKTKQKDPDYNKKQNMFFFQFRLPENYNPETGTMSFSTENMFKGLYIVTTIKHEFKDGKFIQTLDAVRELLTNMLKDGDKENVTHDDPNPFSTAEISRAATTSPVNDTLAQLNRRPF